MLKTKFILSCMFLSLSFAKLLYAPVDEDWDMVDAKKDTKPITTTELLQYKLKAMEREAKRPKTLKDKMFSLFSSKEPSYNPKTGFIAFKKPITPYKEFNENWDIPKESEFKTQKTKDLSPKLTIKETLQNQISNYKNITSGKTELDGDTQKILQAPFFPEDFSHGFKLFFLHNRKLLFPEQSLKEVSLFLQDKNNEQSLKDFYNSIKELKTKITEDAARKNIEKEHQNILEELKKRKGEEHKTLTTKEESLSRQQAATEEGKERELILAEFKSHLKNIQDRKKQNKILTEEKAPREAIAKDEESELDLLRKKQEELNTRIAQQKEKIAKEITFKAKADQQAIEKLVTQEITKRNQLLEKEEFLRRAIRNTAEYQRKNSIEKPNPTNEPSEEGLSQQVKNYIASYFNIPAVPV